MTDLADWFGGISSPPAMNDPPPPTALTRAVGISEGGNPVALSDPLTLAWCADQEGEISGIESASSGPLLCRGCTSLGEGRCDRLGATPVFEDAAYCARFRPRAGVVVGRCWLWRIELPGNKLVWFMTLPTADQSMAIRWARQHYGDAVQSVYPVPGASALPSPMASKIQNSGVSVHE
ncbi:hypothetical protein [Paludibacterium yongneupense]|uniref:hypothetical protein n=1 Tax=Paludibacterium yongneupense TaxID=400061 RepID=UPI0012EC54E3|nr:hypothetical protein [Paludibacterium yongneupense]